ncbi:Oidioi.mRNA.OKI2018_I69.XSR.g15373.t2.cds [Oikopleura dioica]|uniref:Oidioi.mRNA.OKI2018_I69.XSR.g15373.t2.cds n=1 Tax=Oikopleura dioica TaxID=34765 RepID=A0ABN7SHT0_OIKDI|nr:Oidioi.mRNA.OKI2018_I69.XSR.g15373.t2.cds [Oikopleura dioica]
MSENKVSGPENVWLKRGPLRVKTPNELEVEEPCDGKFEKYQKEFPSLSLGDSGFRLKKASKPAKELDNRKIAKENASITDSDTAEDSKEDRMSQDGESQKSVSSCNDSTASMEFVYETSNAVAGASDKDDAPAPQRRRAASPDLDEDLDWDLESLPDPEPQAQPPRKKKKKVIAGNYQRYKGQGKRVYPVEIETDPRTLERREQQIEYGKVLNDYMEYIEAVPKSERVKGQPVTPRKDQVISRRNFDNQIRKWKRQIHFWRDIEKCIEIKDSRYESRGASKKESPKDSPKKESPQKLKLCDEPPQPTENPEQL